MSWEYDTCHRISTICTRRTKWPSIIITIRYLLRNLFLYLSSVHMYIYTLNINQIVCIIGSKRLSVRESRGSRSGRGGAIVLSRNSLLFQRHATDRSRQEEQSRVPGTRGTHREREKKKSPRTFQLFDRFQVSFKISSRSFHRSACTSFYHDPCWMEWNQRRCAS